MRILYDIETDGLLDTMTKIHCACTADMDKKSPVVKRYGPHQIGDFLREVSRADELIGHNIQAFDVPAIKKVFPDFKLKKGCKLTDTLIMARFIYSDIKGSDFDRFKKGLFPGRLIGRHSLEAWGYRIGFLKGDYCEETDWSTYTDEMLEYNERDVALNFHLYNHLCESWGGVPILANEIEHKVAAIIDKQESNGFRFDVKKAEELEFNLVCKISGIKEKLKAAGFKNFYKKGKEFTPKADNKRLGYEKGKTVTKIIYQYFNPDSRDHIEHWFKKKYNWKPKVLTENKSAVLNEDVLKTLKFREAPLLIDYYRYSKVLGMLSRGKNAWLKLVKPNGRIHGRVNSNGAVTGRMTHSKPNMAQIPRAETDLGKWCRILFCVEEGRKLVGVDASGLELRMLAHYLILMGDTETAKEIIEGDIHQKNADILGVDRNPTAKTFIYALMYGASPNKISAVLGCGSREGRLRQEEYFKKMPSLAKLIETVKRRAASRGYLIGLDKRILPVRSQHLALNTLLQSAGAVVMKQALINYDEYITNKELDVMFVGNIHDEIQADALEEHAELTKQLGIQSIVDAGVMLGLKVPLAADGKIGDNWSETH